MGQDTTDEKEIQRKIEQRIRESRQKEDEAKPDVKNPSFLAALDKYKSK